MRLDRLCWEPRGQFYIAMTDAGFFKVPNVRGGWAQRTAWGFSMLCKPMPVPVQQAVVFLGMAAAPKLGGCNCMGRRQ